jgi:hypothetical protein
VRWFAKSFVLPGLLLIAISCSSAWAASSLVPDSDTSTRLTDYLHSHRLPLVGAQVLNSSNGRSVLLYGYTATDFGKHDAETKTRRFLQDSDVVINNHIRVQPELSSMRSSAPASAPAASSAEPPPPDQLGDINSYNNQQQDNAQQQYMNQQAQQYMNQGAGPGGIPGSALNILIPLLGMGMGIGVGGGGTSFGMGGSPGFGAGFGGYGSPFGGGYGSPYGGANPYGPNPYGTSPYGAPSGGSPYP